MLNISLCLSCVKYSMLWISGVVIVIRWLFIYYIKTQTRGTCVTKSYRFVGTKSVITVFYEINVTQNIYMG